MSLQGYSAEIHKVADNGKQLALFLGMALLFVWIVAVNMGVNDLTPRWFQREFDWLASESIPPIFLSMAAASVLSAAGVWLFSGHGEKLFAIDADGITQMTLFGSRHFAWNDFELLEREVATIILHLYATARQSLGPSKLKFDLSGIDCSGPQLEALIVHYRPDLFRTLYVARPKQGDEPAMRAATAADAAPTAKESQAGSQLSQRIARLR